MGEHFDSTKMASESIEDTIMNGSITPPRPPNRKGHEEQISELTTKIKEFDDAKQKANDKLRFAREIVSGFREKRERISAEKADLEDKLNVISKALEAKKDAVQRLKNSFVVTSEEALDQQVKFLQNELQKNHFKATEERKLVNEIDKLNRSRKAIKEFKIVREDMEKLKTTQKDLRDRRDLMFKERGDLKRKEEEAKVEIRDLRDSIEEMKIKIETFAAEKRNAMTEYRIQEMAHKKFITDKREEAKMKRREEKEAAEAQKMKEWEEIKANEEPFEKERFLVSTLILYCQKLDPLYGSEDTIDNCKNGSSSINNAIPDKCVVYRKTDENDVFFPGVKKGSSGKKSAKKQKARNLKHNPETYVQFASLLLKPPTTSKDVPMVIDKLQEKKAYFEVLAEKEK